MAKRKRKQKTVDLEPVYAPGDFIQHPDHGRGMVVRVRDPQIDPDLDFFYDVDFSRKYGGDGTKAWLPKWKTDRDCVTVD